MICASSINHTLLEIHMLESISSSQDELCKVTGHIFHSCSAFLAKNLTKKGESQTEDKEKEIQDLVERLSELEGILAKARTNDLFHGQVTNQGSKDDGDAGSANLAGESADVNQGRQESNKDQDKCSKIDCCKTGESRTDDSCQREGNKGASARHFESTDVAGSTKGLESIEKSFHQCILLYRNLGEVLHLTPLLN